MACTTNMLTVLIYNYTRAKNFCNSVPTRVMSQFGVTHLEASHIIIIFLHVYINIMIISDASWSDVTLVTLLQM